MPTAQTLLIKKTKLKPGQILASVYLEVKNNEIFNENEKYPRSTTRRNNNQETEENRIRFTDNRMAKMHT